MAPIPTADITGIVLAGGRGRRMGGADKGLQLLHGRPLAQIALERLRPQVGALCLSANRNPERYAAFGVPVLADTLPDQPGPLAGFLAGLEHAHSPWLLAVPCDVPGFPADLARRLADALAAAGADLAVPCCASPPLPGAPPSSPRVQPVFCLMRRSLAADLRAWLQAGGRRVDDWGRRHARVDVPFDDASAFANINTAAELQALHA